MNDLEALRFVRRAANPAGSLDALYVLADTTGADDDASIGSIAPATSAAAGRSYRLRIFHFNDLHNALQSRTATGEPAPLFSRIVRRYRRARDAANDDEVVLLLSGG